MMEKDHTAAGDKLKALAQSKNITLPTGLSSDSQKAVDDLQQKSGKDFDKAYINLMEEQLVYGKRLIAFLKKEYRLE